MKNGVKHILNYSLYLTFHYYVGVSFIGQDVCGSRYNTDPFADIDKKPDAFEIFLKKLKAIEDKHNHDNNNKTISNSGKWP